MTAADKRPKTIVTLTPLPVRSDSRTFKQAASVARLGYRSVVLEGPSSQLGHQALPFELVATFEAAPAPAAKEPVAAPVVEDSPSDAATNTREAERHAVWVAGPPPPTGSWDGFRKTIRARIGRMPGGEKALRAIWSVEFKFRNFVHLLRTDPVKAAKMLLYWPYHFLIYRPKWFFIVLYNKTIYSHPNNFRKYIFDYLKSYLKLTFKKTPEGKLYFIHSFHQFPGMYLRSRLSGARYVYDAHDFYSAMDDHANLSAYWREWVLPFHLKVERACVRHAAAVITVNEGIAALMKEKFGRDVAVLRNSHDPRLETPVERTIREVLDLPADKCLVVCVGQWKRDTAIPQAIAAFSSLPDRFHLAFLGAGFPSYAAEVAASGATGRVHFLPAVKATEVVPFIRTADIGLLLYHPVSPSIRNCLPNGFFQPTAAGLPILYPRLPEITRVAERHDLGLPIDPLDPASIAEGVAALGGDADLLAQKKTNVAAARDALSWQRDEEQLKIIIEGLIGAPSAA